MHLSVIGLRQQYWFLLSMYDVLRLITPPVLLFWIDRTIWDFYHLRSRSIYTACSALTVFLKMLWRWITPLLCVSKTDAKDYVWCCHLWNDIKSSYLTAWMYARSVKWNDLNEFHLGRTTYPHESFTRILENKSWRTDARGQDTVSSIFFCCVSNSTEG